MPDDIRMASYQYTVRQFDYNHSLRADSFSEDTRLNELAQEGWELVTADVSSFPYVTTMWRRETGKAKPRP